MRRIVLTALLTTTALAAAWLAPTLHALRSAPEGPSIQFIRPLPTQPRVVQSPPVDAPARPMATRPHRPSPETIPELTVPLPPARPVVAPPIEVLPEEPAVPDSFWDNCPTCGMG